MPLDLTPRARVAFPHLAELDCETVVYEPTRAHRNVVKRHGVETLTPAIVGDFAGNRYGPYADRVRHLLDGLDGNYLTCERRVADARPFDPIRFRNDRRDRLAAYLTTP